ncbi:rubrerythrin family protein [Parabacteroides sp. FAFU027]|uniref:rubrerythrin family protein n=1 Tax=Parabacteroides sp. FAFU027 TaxID=2922715 RepID=UPI001FAFA555|nr:ferritin family protein [Parabacteroides sp. FAFU027]
MRNIFVLALISLIALTGCKQAKPVKTIENLKAGIKGETTASAKYAAFAQKAKEEGHDAVAKLFEAASKAESIHAANHTKALEALGEKMEAIKPEFEVKSTAENLQAAIEGESYETTTMYPQFLKDAQTEKAEKAEKSFTWAFDTEKKHLEFYKSALNALNAKTEAQLPAGYAVCPVCGNTYDAAKVDEKCAFCMTPKEKFLKF